MLAETKHPHARHHNRPMSECSIRRLAYAAWVASLGFQIGSLPFNAGRWLGSPGEALAALAALVAFQGMASLGVLIVRSDAGNRVGWLFCAAPLLMTFGNCAGAYAEFALLRHPGAPAGAVAGALGATWLMGVTLFLSFLVLLFPDGRLPGPRWRPLAWVGGASLAALWVGVLMGPTHLDAPLQHVRNPLAVSLVGTLQVGGVLVPVLMAAGVCGAVVRYRRGGPVEREQLRWFVAAVLAVAVLVGLLLASSAAGVPTPTFLPLLALCLIPAAVGVAILRYRLYEIDVIVRRTIVYTVLVALLALLYGGGIAAIGWVLRDVAGQSSALAVTLSTLAVAVAFQPLRARIQAAVDRRFARRRYDATAAVAGFSGRLRDQVDLDAIAHDLIDTARQTMQPRTISVWLRGEDT
jgi:hypothetical protein